MSRALSIVGLAAVLAACTGQGIDRSHAVPVRASLEVRPVADGDPWVNTVAATAQGTLSASDVEVAEEIMTSRSLPPVRSQRIHAREKPALVELARRTGPAPAGMALAYERERDDWWGLVVVRVDEGMALSPATAVTLAWAKEPGEQPDPEGVYLLLDRDDGERFETLTIEHDGRRLAILAGEEVLMAPTVLEPIGGGQLLITPGGGASAIDLYERLTGLDAPPRP
jgi:hypothetical protein